MSMFALLFALMLALALLLLLLLWYEGAQRQAPAPGEPVTAELSETQASAPAWL